jgi:putative nucleotidyltransferase with HDIG domain
MPIKAKVYITLIIAVGLSIITTALFSWESQIPSRYVCYLLIASLASALKVRIPGITGTMSVNFLFILIGIIELSLPIGIIELSLPETLAMGCIATVIQSFWHAGKRPKPVQVVFNVSSMAIAIGVTYSLYHSNLAARFALSQSAVLAMTACTFFVMNTVPVAAVIALTDGKPIRKVWQECYFWFLPYYLVGASVAWLLSLANRYAGWQASILVLPVVGFIYRSYGLYLERLEDEKKHASEMAALHLRTIEALALAIEAKDHAAHDHLRRVQVYAVELGKQLRLSDQELEALRAAAILHDIGKLAVPEHIISKPGKLTPEEFEKMKVHPLVGAEILERVKFPYPVVPIVRAHHEKWDGSGYPAGLKGEEIPIGARILAAVDCLDALSSDRQYRRALPLDQAMQYVESEAGRGYDPRVVALLKEHCQRLEQSVQVHSAPAAPLPVQFRIERGAAPGAGFQGDGKEPGSTATASSFHFLSSIAAARQEMQVLFELTQDLGSSLSLDETLSVLATRLRRMIPCDSLAIYVRQGQKLLPEYVNGENCRLFSSLEIPVGEGLSGWVAATGKPILNGNPSAEPGYLNDSTKFSTLNSALAVPLEGLSDATGVLTLYKSEKDAFTKDHLRFLLAISYKVALSIENALKYRQAERSATTDFLTQLPNARSLFLHLDRELARSKRFNVPLAVLVCDLDGFKQLNDKLGHLEGNRVLSGVARR